MVNYEIPRFYKKFKITKKLKIVTTFRKIHGDDFIFGQKLYIKKGKHF